MRPPRTWLAEDNLEDRARAVTHAAAAMRIPLIPADAHLLEELYELGGFNQAALALLDITEAPHMPLASFAPTDAAAHDWVAWLTDQSADPEEGTPAIASPVGDPPRPRRGGLPGPASAPGQERPQFGAPERRAVRRTA